MPDLLDFFQYCAYAGNFKYRYLAGSRKTKILNNAFIGFLETYRKSVKSALKKSKRFNPPETIYELAEGASKVISLGHQTGEGWFLTAEMVELIQSDVKNIICMQPFACLPNHVTGKGMIKELKRVYPGANIAAIDYDPGASEVNQLNRIKLMLSVAFKAMKDEKAKADEKKKVAVQNNLTV